MRKHVAKKGFVSPDPKFNDILVSKFVSNLMKGGKKSIAFSVFYKSLEIVEEQTKESGYETWKKALENIAPFVEVKSRRIGGATLQIPIEVRDERKSSLGMKWLISFSRKRNGKSMSEKLAQEIISASKGEGAAVKKREDTHRMAEANKAFSHFRL